MYDLPIPQLLNCNENKLVWVIFDLESYINNLIGLQLVNCISESYRCVGFYSDVIRGRFGVLQTNLYLGVCTICRIY